jgi:hypothetical protein
MATDYFDMIMSGAGLNGYKPRSALDLLISNKLTPDQNKAVQSRGRLGLAKGLLAMSGPSTTPISFGQAFASGIDQMQQARSGAVDEMLKGAQISNLTDDGEVDEDLKVTLTTNDPKTPYDDTKRQVIIKRSEYNPEIHRLETEEEPDYGKKIKVYFKDDATTTDVDESQESTMIFEKDFDSTIHTADKVEEGDDLEVYMTTNNPNTKIDETQVKTLIKRKDYDKTIHRLEKDEVELPTMKVYPKVDDPKTEVDETQESIAIKPSKYDENKYSLDPGFVDKYTQAKKDAERITDKPAEQLEYIKSQMGFVTDADKKLYEQKIKLNNQQIFRQEIENQYAPEIARLEGEKLELFNKGKELSNDYQEAVNGDYDTLTKLDIQSKQLGVLKQEAEMVTFPDLKIAELENLKTNLEATRQNIDFNDSANILKLDKMSLEIDGLLLKNQASKYDIEQAPARDKLINEGMQIDNAIKQIDLDFKPKEMTETLANLELRNEKLMQELNFDDKNNILTFAINQAKLDEIKYKMENPDKDWEEIKVAGKFRTDFENLPQVKAVISAQTYYLDISEAVAKQNWNEGKDATNAGDLSLMFNFLKMLDPESVVREGEQGTLRAGKGVPEKWKTMVASLNSGEFLGVEQREDILQVTEMLMENRVGKYNDIHTQYSQIAEKSGLDVEISVPKLNFEKWTAISDAEKILSLNADNGGTGGWYGKL